MEVPDLNTSFRCIYLPHNNGKGCERKILEGDSGVNRKEEKSMDQRKRWGEV